jgi:uncharacterized protein (TIGR02147 family)
MKSVFDYKQYKRYLQEQTGTTRKRDGQKSALAEAIRCQTTYLSRVLHGDADLSLEQAERVSLHFSHTEDEAHYFILMVQKARAGTSTLATYFQKQLDEILAKRLVLRERVDGSNALSKSDQAEYYSSWHYAAIHIALTIPALQTRESLCRYFRIPPRRVARILEYLQRVRLVSEVAGIYAPTQSYLMLGNDSANIIRHHANWRNRAINSLEAEKPEEMHYSAVVSMSREDVVRIKENLMQVIQKNLAMFKESKEEEVFCCCIDLFNLGQ